MRLTEGQTFFATIAFFVALPVIGGLFVSLFRSMKSEMDEPTPAAPVNEGAELVDKFSRGPSTENGTVWQYQRCYLDGRPYSTQFVIGNSVNPPTKFVFDSSYPRGHALINGSRARVFATEQDAENELLAIGERKKRSDPNVQKAGVQATNPNPYNTAMDSAKRLTDTLTKASAGGGFGSADSSRQFNF